MQDQEPTVRAWEIGHIISQRMNEIGMSQIELARLLEWSPSMVSRMITGKRPVSAELMSAVLALLGITGRKRRSLMAMARRATELGWWQEFGACLPLDLTTLSTRESVAKAIITFETNYIPVLLQTPEYMTAELAAMPTIPDGEREPRMKARLLRQDILDRKKPRFRFFIDEYAICRAGVDWDIMSGQVHHLLRLSVRPNVDIRVIPAATGFHAGRMPFQLMEFDELRPIVFVETDTSALFIERDDAVAGYRMIEAGLTGIAMSEGESRRWLTDLGEPKAPRPDNPADPAVAVDPDDER